MNEMPEQPIDPPEETIRSEASYDEARQTEIDDVYHINKDVLPKQVSHDFPLESLVKGVLIEIDETGRAPIQAIIDMAHATLRFIDEVALDLEYREAEKAINEKAIAGLSEIIEKATERVQA